MKSPSKEAKREEGQTEEVKILNWSNGLVRYNLALIIIFIVCSAIGCAKGPAVGLELKPNDLGSDWAYKVKMGPTSYGGNPQFFLDGRNLCLSLNQVIVKNDARVIKSILQDVMVYPYVEEAVDRLKGLSTQAEPLDLPFWDEAFWCEQEAGLTLRKANYVVTLCYKEVLYKKDPLSGKFYHSEYLPLSEEQKEWANDFLCNLAEIVQRKIVAR